MGADSWEVIHYGLTGRGGPVRTVEEDKLHFSDYDGDPGPKGAPKGGLMAPEGKGRNATTRDLVSGTRDRPRAKLGATIARDWDTDSFTAPSQLGDPCP